MSMNRENIVWQSPDGTWNRGFWDFEYTCSPEHEDFDPEWDVEYSCFTFRSFRGGFATEEQAGTWQPGANPGHVSYAADDEVEYLERVKLRFVDPTKAAELDRADRQREVTEKIAAARVKSGDEIEVVVAKTMLVYGGRLVTNDAGETVLSLPSRGPLMPDRPNLVILNADGTPNGDAGVYRINKRSTHDRFSRRW